jgi:MFS family permease
MVFTGSLIGILSARVMSGYVAEAAGWRWVYAISAGLILLATTAVVLALPNSQPRLKGTYTSLLRSTVHQIVRFPLLRRVTLQSGKAMLQSGKGRDALTAKDCHRWPDPARQ